MKFNAQIRYSAIALAIVLMASSLSFSPTSVKSQTEQAPTCSQGPPPGDPVTMNTVLLTKKTKQIAKTVHAEKTILFCVSAAGGPPQIFDITIYAEIYQNMTNAAVFGQIIGKQVEVVTCVKDPNARDPFISVNCIKSTPSTTGVPTVNCSEVPIDDPQEMNTITNKARTLAKTIESQKEVFQCTGNSTDPTDDRIVDLVLFTEIGEDSSKLPDNPVVFKKFEALRCEINPNTGVVESCVFSTVSPGSPLQQSCPPQDRQRTTRDPVTMNSVLLVKGTQQIAKTVHAEKTILDCAVVSGTVTAPVIDDITIYAEIYEDMTTAAFGRIIGKQVEVVTCKKDESRAFVRQCIVSTPPATSTVTLSNCSEVPIADPQEMNTITDKTGKLAKTIESQKEVFLCIGDPTPADDRIVDVVIFTEIGEQSAKLPKDPVVFKKIESLRCVINPNNGVVESCIFSPEQTLALSALVPE